MSRFHIILFLTFIYSITCSYGNEITFFTSKNSSFNSIQIETIRNLYLGREKFIGSSKIQVVDLKNDQPIFLEKLIKKEIKNYNGLWRMMVFTGQALAPKVFKSNKELFEYVASNKNVLAYTTSKLDHSELKSLKIVL